MKTAFKDDIELVKNVLEDKIVSAMENKVVGVEK